VETKNHAIFTELTRVRQYMEKIQKLEAPPAERETTVNTEVTARFLRSDLVSCRAPLCCHNTLDSHIAG
jgi:exosome complex protein LRP1